MRTLRIPNDGNRYPLPPALGRIPVHACADFPDFPLPREELASAYFIPMFQNEALWLSFEAAKWKPNAVKVGVGRINAVSGEAWDATLCADPQDYIVVPDQPWLDGINSEMGGVRQFVAVPLGTGQSVESQLARLDEIGGIQLVFLEPKPGKFPDEPPSRPPSEMQSKRPSRAPGTMGLGAGGRIAQKIYPDRYGVDTWDPQNCVSLFIHIVNSQDYRVLTGREPPPTSITAATYTEFGLPWFRMYDESCGDIAVSKRMTAVQPIEDRHPGDNSESETVDVPEEQIIKLRPPRDDDADG